MEDSKKADKLQQPLDTDMKTRKLFSKLLDRITRSSFPIVVLLIFGFFFFKKK